MAPMPFGLQLFSVRGECAKDLPATLKAVRGIGYQAVEPWGYDGSKVEWQAVPARDLRRMLDDNGLTCCGMHLLTAGHRQLRQRRRRSDSDPAQVPRAGAVGASEGLRRPCRIGHWRRQGRLAGGFPPVPDRAQDRVVRGGGGRRRRVGLRREPPQSGQSPPHGQVIHYLLAPLDENLKSATIYAKSAIGVLRLGAAALWHRRSFMSVRSGCAD